ncbi:MAG TPA: DUF1573 domain-containing protein [Candidatus Margulisiibacteriota bacterium]|nr:DUF1573 domain-containing protein [Candidatus Margulisiibacteriota bacterium]
MFKFSLALLMVLLIISGCWAQQDPYLWDFGVVKEGEVLKHEFVLKNESAKKLTIKEVATSCGCTASEAKKKELLPGESTTIEVKFQSKGYSGAVKQVVYVTTDNLDNMFIKYIIKANVVRK